MKFLKLGTLFILTSLSGVALGNNETMESNDKLYTQLYVSGEPNPLFTMEDLGFYEEWDRTRQKDEEALVGEWTLSKEELENGLRIFTNMFEPKDESLDYLNKKVASK